MMRLFTNTAKQETSMKPVESSAVFLIGLFFDPEDGDAIFLRNVC
jgi:hypothetical protein